MSKGRPVRCYDYVNHPYERVRDALSGKTLEVFHEATRAAASRARSVAADLRVNVGGVEVGTEISISVTDIQEQPKAGLSPPKTVMHLEWKSAKLPSLFPFMRADLAVYPLTATETQLDFAGNYEAPLGMVGSAIDAVVGHRIAEASVHRFLTDVATYLKTTLASASGA